MAGEWISQWIPTIIIIIMALVAFSIIAYRLIGIGSTASIFDAEHNTIARELYINQSGYWIVTIQYAGGVYPVYGIVLKNGELVRVKWPVPVYTGYNPVLYRFVEYNVYSPGDNPPVVVLLKVGTSIVGVKIMPEFRVSLLPYTTVTAVAAPRTTTVTTTTTSLVYTSTTYTYTATYISTTTVTNTTTVPKIPYIGYTIYIPYGCPNGINYDLHSSVSEVSGSLSSNDLPFEKVGNLTLLSFSGDTVTWTVTYYYCYEVPGPWTWINCVSGTLNSTTISVQPFKSYYFDVKCSTETHSTTTSTTSTTPPPPTWSIYISVNDPYNAGWRVSDYYGNSVPGSTSVSNVLLGTYSSNESPVLLSAIITSIPNGYTACSISPAEPLVSEPPSGKAYVIFQVSCTGSSTTSSSTTTITSPPSPPGTWSVAVNVNAPSNVGWQISTSPSATIDGTPGASSLDGSGTSTGNTFTYPASVSSATLTGSIVSAPSGESCQITPQSVTVTPSTGSVTFTVTCSNNTSTPPTSPTTTVTYTTTIQFTTGIVFTCVGPANVPIGQAAVEECVAGWAYTSTYGQLSVGYPTATATNGPVVMTGTITLSPLYATLTPVPQTFAWGYSGTCPNNWQPIVEASGPSPSEAVWTTSYVVTWYVTIQAYCQPRGTWFIFMFPWEWNPPVLPIWLLLRGGTNTLAPMEPIYIQAFNNYANWFWANAGWLIDLLILLALITPVLARPIIVRRIGVQA